MAVTPSSSLIFPPPFGLGMTHQWGFDSVVAGCPGPEWCQAKRARYPPRRTATTRTAARVCASLLIRRLWVVGLTGSDSCSWTDTGSGMSYCVQALHLVAMVECAARRSLT